MGSVIQSGRQWHEQSGAVSMSCNVVRLSLDNHSPRGLAAHR